MMGLRASVGHEPTPCDECKLLLINTWLGDLIAPTVFLILILAVEFQFNTQLLDVGSIPSMLGFVASLIVVRYVFTSPTPYRGRKSWCPKCARNDAIHDWTDDPTCMECESKLRPGMRVKTLDE